MNNLKTIGAFQTAQLTEEAIKLYESFSAIDSDLSDSEKIRDSYSEASYELSKKFYASTEHLDELVKNYVVKHIDEIAL